MRFVSLPILSLVGCVALATLALSSCTSGAPVGCARTADCGRGEACIEGTCHQICTSTHECPADKLCKNGTCQAGGVACRASADCVDPSDLTCLVPGSGSCEGGYCTFGFAGVETTCNDGDECTSGDHCDGGACVGTPFCNFDVGTACTSAEQCASASCESGMCCAADRDCCHNDAECAAGLACDVTTSVCFVGCAADGVDLDAHCQAAFHCDAGVCRANLIAFSACDEGSDCIDHRCESSLCCPGAADCCAVDADCGGTYACNKATHTCYAACLGGNSAYCQSAAYCTAANACVLTLGLGGPCGNNNDACQSGWCDSTRCCALGSDCCTSNADCASNFACDVASHLCHADCTALNQATNCKPSINCTSGDCCNGTCAAAGTVCTGDADCASGNCSPASGTPRYCCPAGGFCCVSDADCPGEYACNTATHACYGSGGCTLHTQCKSSGYCQSGLNQCVHDSGLHQACTFNEACATGICESGVCCNGGEDCCKADADCAGNYVCDVANQTCFATCASAPANCKSTTYCSAGACYSRRINGDTCLAGSECVSSFCIDTRCCNEACLGVCRSCNVVGAAGTCTAVPAGTDPAAECTLAACSGDFCSGDASVPGASHCQYSAANSAPNVGFSCTGTCKANSCSGSGTCASAPNTQTCAVERCTLTCTNGSCVDTVCGAEYCCDCKDGSGPWCAADGPDCTAQCSPTCFVAGTPVLMAEGAARAIEDVQVGDVVQSFDEASGRVVVARVTHVFVHAHTPALVSLNHGRLVTTPEHRFYVDGRWVAARDLVDGDSVSSVSTLGAPVEAQALRATSVFALELRRGGVTTYNLEVEGTHTYFVDGILVHNMKQLP